MNNPDKNPTFLPRIGDFYARIFRRGILGFLLAQAIFAFLIIFADLYILDHFGLDKVLIFTVFAVLIGESLMIFVFLKKILYPTEAITRALVQISGEDSLAPPDRNSRKFAKIGLNLLLNQLYDLAEKAKKCDEKILTNNEKLLQNLISALPVGVIALNARREIIATNSLAPIFYSSEENRRAIKLDFSEAENSLDEWLNYVEKNSVSAEKLWSRVQNSPPESENRQIFDVLAHYKKDAVSGIETIIITIDKTAEYCETETNMDFIALAAHELRGPITVIRGYLDILDEQLSGKISPDEHQLIDRMNVSAKRLSAYVNNILNASRYDRRHLQLKLTETNVAQIVADIADDMDLRARTLNRQLFFEIPPNLPTVAADHSSVDEVLANLIDNAIKYSFDGGRIDVGAEIDGDFVAIFVRDYGVGIPANVAEHLFSKFYRSHRSRGAVNGSGLGLYISRAIIESHGGHISVESRENEGSVFTFTLPIFATVADKLTDGNSNENLIRDGGNWIKNHGRIKD